MRSWNCYALFRGSLVILLLMTVSSMSLSCRKVSKDELISPENLDGPSGSETAGMKEFTEGGTMTLTASGQQVSVRLTTVHYNNTDTGYPDFIEVSGDGTYVTFVSPMKLSDFEEGTEYSKLVGVPISFDPNFGSADQFVTVPQLGRYAVQGGSLTLTTFESGMDGRDHWTGQVLLNLETSQGVLPVPGSFDFTIVQLW